MICPQCGADLVDEAAFCHQCGARLDGNAATGGNPAAAVGTPNSPLSPRGGDDDPERLLWQGGYSPKAMIGSWIAAAAITVVLLVAGFMLGGFPYKWMLLLGLIALMWCWLGARLGFQLLNVRYRLTTQRFVHERGILRRVTDRIEVIDMDDISFSQGLIERLVGVGTVNVLSSDSSHPEIHLAGIDGVRKVAQMMDDARRKERLRRGLHIEAI